MLPKKHFSRDSQAEIPVWAPLTAEGSSQSAVTALEKHFYIDLLWGAQANSPHRWDYQLLGEKRFWAMQNTDRVFVWDSTENLYWVLLSQG